MVLGLTMPAPHGGIFVYGLAGGMGGWLISVAAFLGCILLGAVVTAVMVTFLKPDLTEEEREE